MPRIYRRFSREFKMQIVQAVLQGAAVSGIALREAGEASSWVGPATWMSDGDSPSWSTFCGQFKSYGASC
jgi:hypothetical protein